MYLKEIDLLGCGLDSSGSGYGPVADFCGHGNETSKFHKRRVI
jgi:methionine aminopeptidase